MHRRIHQVMQSGIDHTVPRDLIFSGKGFRYDAHVKMRLARIPGPDMSRMTMGFIGNFKT